MKKILLAGIGNIFHGDDAFGCEVIRELNLDTLPDGVIAIDYGIKSYDLAYALLEDYQAVVLIDATGRGQEPGTVYLMELDLSRLNEFGHAEMDPHAMNPVAVIQMAKSFGGIKAKLYLIGCEPAVLESLDGAMELSDKVKAAVPRGVALTFSFVQDLLQGKQTTDLNFTTAGKD